MGAESALWAKNKTASDVAESWFSSLIFRKILVKNSTHDGLEK
jgi:hypothetical protein